MESPEITEAAGGSHLSIIEKSMESIFMPNQIKPSDNIGLEANSNQDDRDGDSQQERVLRTNFW